MMFNDLIQKIDSEIAKGKERGRRLWFDHDQDLTGISEKIRLYYTERGYMIEIIPCKACLGQKADIIISW
jgi:hypothetical protein